MNTPNNNTITSTLAKSPSRTQFKIGLQYMFNFLVWKAREGIKDGKEKKDGAAQSIYRCVLNRIGWLTPASLTDSQLPGNKIPEADKKDYTSRIRSYGASSKRTAAQKEAARSAINQIQANLPDSAIEVWTDGSKLGRAVPGPAGAGVVFMQKGNVLNEIIYYLGDSTNQASELWAIGGALETLKESERRQEEIHIFTDSQFAIDCIKGKYFSAEHYYRIAKIKKVERELKCTIRYHHVAGHADIEGNERADKLAKKGSRYSQQNANLDMLSLDEILKHYSFNYLRLDGVT